MSSTNAHLRDDGVGDASSLVQKVLLGFHFTTSVTQHNTVSKVITDC